MVADHFVVIASVNAAIQTSGQDRGGISQNHADQADQHAARQKTRPRILRQPERPDQPRILFLLITYFIAGYLVIEDGADGVDAGDELLSVNVC